MLLKACITICALWLGVHSIEACNSSAACPKSNRYYVETFYKANWHQAYQFCRFQGLQLATVQSQEDADALKTQIAEAGMLNEVLWLSGTDLAGKDKWYWASNGRPWSVKYWSSGKPDNQGGNERCLQLERGGKLWNDNECHLKFYFVCEPAGY